MTSQDLLAAELNPVEFMYPFLEAWTAHTASFLGSKRESQLRGLYPQAKSTRKVTEQPTLDDLYSRSLKYQLYTERLCSVKDNIERFNGETTKANKLLDDLTKVVKQVHALRDWNRERLDYSRDDLNRYVSNLAIKESQKSIEQAVSVKREWITYYEIQIK